MTFNEDLVQRSAEFINEEWTTVFSLLSSIKEDIGLRILNTEPSNAEERSSLYFTAKAVDLLAAKLQHCINETKPFNQEMTNV